MTDTTDDRTLRLAHSAEVRMTWYACGALDAWGIKDDSLNIATKFGQRYAAAVVEREAGRTSSYPGMLPALTEYMQALGVIESMRKDSGDV